MVLKFKNFWVSALTVPAAAADTKLTIATADAAALPPLATGESIRLVLPVIEVVSGNETGWEIVDVTAINTTTGELTVTRAVEGTTAKDWAKGSMVDLRITQAALDGKANADSLASHVADTANPHATTAAQVGADPAGTATAAMDAHLAATDPHTQYTTATEAAAAAPVQSVAGKTGTVTLVKADVGLGLVDNTADIDKPVSTATQTVLKPLAQYADLFSDAIVSGLTTATSTTLTGTLAAGVAYVLGQRVVYAGGTYTVAASSTSYLDLSNTGVVTVTTSTTVTANSLRLWSVTSDASAITAVAQVASVSPTFTPSQTNISYDGSAQSLTGAAFTTLIFPNKVNDALGEYDATTGIFTPQESGTYLIYVTLESSNSVTNQRLLVSLSANSGTDGVRVLAGYSSSNARLNISAMRPVYLAGASINYLNCYVITSETLAGGSSCAFSILRIK